MLARVAIVLVAAGLLAAAPAPAPARAADRVVARDTLISYVWPLDGDFVYDRFQFRKPLPKRVWMASFGGHLHPARGIPRRAWTGDIGIDARGRKMFTFAIPRHERGKPDTGRWFAYDLARNRTRPLRGLPKDCAVLWVSLWRRDMAYEAACGDDPSDAAVFLRRGKRTREVVPDPDYSRLHYRDGALAQIIDDGSDAFFIRQWMANGESCEKRIDESWGDDSSEWLPTDPRITNGYITWVMGNWAVRPDYAILAAKVPPGCHAPGPVGTFPFTPETTERLRTLAVDERRVFYADSRTLRRQLVPRTPSIDPPPNDDFAEAEPLSGDAPLSVAGRVAHATVEPGEPLAYQRHTVWYAYTPAKSGAMYVRVFPGCDQIGNCGGFRFGVYTGTSPGTLEEIPQSDDGYNPRYTRVDAVAGRTYWIAVGSRAVALEASYMPFTLHVDAAP